MVVKKIIQKSSQISSLSFVISFSLQKVFKVFRTNFFILKRDKITELSLKICHFFTIKTFLTINNPKKEKKKTKTTDIWAENFSKKCTVDGENGKKKKVQCLRKSISSDKKLKVNLKIKDKTVCVIGTQISTNNDDDIRLMTIKSIREPNLHQILQKKNNIYPTLNIIFSQIISFVYCCNPNKKIRINIKCSNLSNNKAYKHYFLSFSFMTNWDFIKKSCPWPLISSQSSSWWILMIDTPSINQEKNVSKMSKNWQMVTFLRWI